MWGISVSSGAWLKEIGGCVKRVDLGVQADGRIDLAAYHPLRISGGVAGTALVVRGLCGVLLV